MQESKRDIFDIRLRQFVAYTPLGSTQHGKSAAGQLSSKDVSRQFTMYMILQDIILDLDSIVSYIYCILFIVLPDVVDQDTGGESGHLLKMILRPRETF